MVMEDDSCLKGRGFEYRHRILNGMTFFTFICRKNGIVCLIKTEINEKEAGDGPFLKKS